MSTPQDHWRMQLNNYLQRNQGRQALTWDCGQAGPRHAPSWTAKALINGIEYGRGNGATRGAAQEAAAYHALAALQRGQ